MELEDWQHKFHSIQDRGLHLLQTEKWADCSFLVGDASPNQKIIKGHKLILARTSPVFERMFYGPLAEKEYPIVIPDVQPDAFQTMLDYIYSDRINMAEVNSFDKVCELCCAANKYMLPYVVKRCSKYLEAYLSPKNACRTYELAKLFDDSRLMQSSMNLIAARTREVLTDSSFTDIKVSTLMTTLDQNKLNIDSELDLFNALLRIANKRRILNEDSLQNAGQQHSAQTSSMANDGILHVEKIKTQPDVNAMMLDQFDETMLKKAVKKIRFLSMTPQQFADGPARSNLLQQHEVLTILTKLCSSSTNNCPMPEGFCSRTSRRNNQPAVLGVNRNLAPNDDELFFFSVIEEILRKVKNSPYANRHPFIMSLINRSRSTRELAAIEISYTHFRLSIQCTTKNRQVHTESIFFTMLPRQ